MMAAAFVGVASIKGSDDSDANDTIINEASGNVSYIPGTINLSVGGQVTFTPTVNWSNYPSNYTITTTISVTSTATNIIVNTSTDGHSTLVSTGSTSVTVKAYTDTYVDEKFTVTSVSQIKYNGDTIATRTATQDVEVNVYSDVVFSTSATVTTCYFGDDYSLDVTSLLSSSGSSSSNLAISVSGLPTGLYILGNTIGGYAEESNFSDAGDTSALVSVTIVDTTTGATTTGTISIPLSQYKISVIVSGANIVKGGTVYVDQGSTSIATVNIDKNNTVSSLSYTIDGGSSQTITPTTTGGVVSGAISINNTNISNIIGTHVCVISYTINGYTGTYTFNVSVIEDTAVFIIPDPSISISVTS
jgi:hypothetical protein